MNNSAAAPAPEHIELVNRKNDVTSNGIAQNMPAVAEKEEVSGCLKFIFCCCGDGEGCDGDGQDCCCC